MEKIYLIILLVLGSYATAAAQTERMYTVNAELPNSMITSLAQDSVGNIWIGTEYGLCRYDGAKFTTYLHNASDTMSLLSNSVEDIYVTKEGKVMIGTRCGLQVYDPEYNNFKEVQLQKFGNKTEPVHVAAIKSLKNGDIIIGTLGNGLQTVKPDTKIGRSAVEKNRAEMFMANTEVCPDNSIWTYAIREGAWHGTWGKDGKLKLTMVPGSLDWKTNDIVSDKHGNAYYATQDGVYKVSGKDLSHKLIFDYKKEKILCLEFVSDNLMLLGTEGSGIIGYDIAKGEVTDIGFNTGRTDISQTKVRDMLIDRNGNLWAGLYQRGVLACQSHSAQFDYIGTGSATADIIGTHPVMALYQSPDGTLWVVSDQDGLYAIKDNVVTHHYPDGANGLPQLITNVFMASDGTVWIQSIDTGMARLNPASATFTHAEAFRGKSVFDIVEDNKHRLWVATMGNGLYCTDLQGNILYTAPSTDQRHYTPGSDLLNNNWINSLTLSADGKKLFINTCYGVGCYDIEVGSYVNTFGENRILVGEMCYDSYLDEDGSLWVATATGLYRWHADEDKIAHYDSDNGLCNNTIVGITGDAKGNIWLATYYGLSKMDKATGKFTNYYAHDGIQGNEFSLRAMYRTGQGVIYAGGLNGITVFKDIEQSAKAPQLRIADVYLHDQPVNSGTESDGVPIIRIGEKGRTYEFDINDNSIGVELTTDQFNNNNIRYQYRIDSGEWSTLQPGANKVYFSNLSAGRHTIEFKAVTFGTESEVESIEVRIRQHWYLRWWALTIYCAIMCLILYMIYRAVRNRRRMEAEIKEQRKKEEFNNSTMQFLVNIAHEIRTPISLITNPIRQLAELHTDTESKHLFTIIRNNTNRMMLLANQLLDVRKIDHNQLKLRKRPVEMTAYTRRAMDLFTDMAHRKQIELKLEASPDPLYAKIDANQFDKIIVNLLSNAFKYTEKHGHITVSVTGKDGTIVITVADDGTGIPVEHIEHIFDRFYQADDKKNYSHLGSGVGLHLTSLLVAKHDGSITAANNADGHGVTFTVVIPACEVKEGEIPDADTSPQVAELIDQHISEESDYELETKDLKSKPTLYIIEDNAETRGYLHEQLQNSYNIMTYDNAKDALTAIHTKKPDILITDVVLPGIDGITLIKSIRQNININDLPIIVLSGKSDEADIMDAIKSGADYYMTKPFNIRLLKTYAENLLRQRHRLKVIYKGDQSESDITIESPDIKTPDSQLMERLSKAINENISNPDYTIVDLASDVCMSRVHLNRKLKQLTNQSPSAYLRNMRLSKAAEILREKPGIAVSDVATAVGMTSFSHFSHAFKELYGCSPSEYASRQSTGQEAPTQQQP